MLLVSYARSRANRAPGGRLHKKSATLPAACPSIVIYTSITRCLRAPDASSMLAGQNRDSTTVRHSSLPPSMQSWPRCVWRGFSLIAEQLLPTDRRAAGRLPRPSARLHRQNPVRPSPRHHGTRPEKVANCPQTWRLLRWLAGVRRRQPPRRVDCRRQLLSCNPRLRAPPSLPPPTNCME